MGYFKTVYQAELPHGANMYLKDRANQEGTCYPSITTIAKELKLSRSTVKRAIQDLIDHRTTLERKWWQKQPVISPNKRDQRKR